MYEDWTVCWSEEGMNNIKGSEKELYQAFPQALSIAFAPVLERLSVLEGAKSRSLVRTAARTRALLGEDAGSYTVATACLGARRALVARFLAESQRMRIVRPECNETICVVHGRVVDDTGLGHSGFSVIARDHRDMIVGRGPTNDGGYFKLEVGLGESAAPPGGPGSGRGRRVGRGEGVRRRTEGIGSGVGHFYIEVLDSGGQTLFRDRRATKVGRGQVVYREIPVDSA